MNYYVYIVIKKVLGVGVRSDGLGFSIGQIDWNDPDCLYRGKILPPHEKIAYIGVRKCKAKSGNPRDDLGVLYFTSSRDQQFKADFKANPDDYHKLILAEGLTAREAWQREREEHVFFDVAKNPVFINRAIYVGSHLSAEHTEETKRRISAANKGRKFSATSRQKMSIAKKGKPSWNKGKKGNLRTAESCAKQSATMRGRKFSLEHRERLAAANRGRKVSLETRRKISKTLTGRKLPPPSAATIEKKRKAALGRRHSEETKKKIGAASKGRNIGYKHTPAAKAKLSLAALNRKKMECPYCGIRCAPNIYAKYHGDKCRHRNTLL